VAAEGVRENTRTRVIEMYEAGWKQVDIAKELKVTKGSGVPDLERI
jgi:transcriptional regulator